MGAKSAVRSTDAVEPSRRVKYLVAQALYRPAQSGPPGPPGAGDAAARSEDRAISPAGEVMEMRVDRRPVQLEAREGAALWCLPPGTAVVSSRALSFWC